MDKLQWGNRKRLRCVKVKDPSLYGKSEGSSGGGVVKRKITSRVIDNNHNNNNNNGANTNNTCKDAHAGSSVPSPHRSNRDMSRSSPHDIRKAAKSLSPEKEDRYYYTTRGTSGIDDGSRRTLFANPKEESRKHVWPKLLITLSSKEKEEDFMAMKGCRPPQRPKKRAKLIQRSVLSVIPGVWLTDLCQERYEVREKKTSKKKPRGLKGLGSVESDSE